MPNLIGFGAGAGATALTIVLGVAFWPPMEKAPSPAKASVSQPVFVVSTPPAKTHASAGLAATGVADETALAKLAVALQSDSPAMAPASATRSMTFAVAHTGASAPVNENARRLCALGLVALGSGDIAGARLYLERAAEAGDARAFMALGASYDPSTLARMGAMGIKGDAAKARGYYAKALAAGMGAARERLAALDAP